MKRLRPNIKWIKKLGGLVVVLWLAACNDTPTLTPEPKPVTATSTTAPTVGAGPTSTSKPITTAIPAASAPVSAPTPTQGATTTAPASASTSPVSTPTATASPFKPSIFQLSEPSCCQLFRFADNGRIYYYDKPADGKVGTYLLDIVRGPLPQLLYSRFGNFMPDLSLVAVSDKVSGLTTIEQVSDGAKRASLPNRATSTLISPDKNRLAYLLRSTSQAGPEAPQLFELWVGNIDGSGLKAVWTLREGDNLAWFPDSKRLLLTARDQANQRFGLWVVDSQAPPNQNATLIVESKGLVAANLSSDGQRVVYAVTLQGEAGSGIWLANSDGTNRRKLAWVGAWRWSPAQADELFYIPARSSGETGSALWSYNATAGQTTRLTDPAQLKLQIAADEWQVAPEARSLVYRNAGDNALWLLRFRP